MERLRRGSRVIRPRLEAMADYWAVPTVSWFGGSDPLRSPTHLREMG